MRDRDAVIDRYYFELSTLADQNKRTKAIWEEYWDAVQELHRSTPDGMEHLADMHPAEALIEIDSLYNDLSDTIKNKHEKTYEGVPEEFIADLT